MHAEDAEIQERAEAGAATVVPMNVHHGTYQSASWTTTDTTEKVDAGVQLFTNILIIFTECVLAVVLVMLFAYVVINRPRVTVTTADDTDDDIIGGSSVPSSVAPSQPEVEDTTLTIENIADESTASIGRTSSVLRTVLTTSSTTTTTTVPTTSTTETTESTTETTEPTTRTTTVSTVMSTVTTTSTSTTTTTTTTTMTSTTTGTTTKKTTTTAGPYAIPQKALLCFVRNQATKSTLFPAEGLCHFVFLLMHVNARTNRIYYSGTASDPLDDQTFYLAARTSARTRYGISIARTKVYDASIMFQTPGGSAALRKLWDMNIRHYGCLDEVLSGDTDDMDVKNAIKLLKAFRTLQGSFRQHQKELPSFIFLGVSVQHSAGSTKNPKLERYFNKLMSDASPDAVVFVTSYSSLSRSGCRVTGPNLWKDDSTHGQPTFVSALEFQRSVTLPDGVRALMSFSVYGRSYTSFRMHPFTVLNGQGSNCKDAGLADRQQFCFNQTGDSLRTDYALQQEYLLTKPNNVLYVYDSVKTIEKKMCWSAVNYSYDGGYAMYGVEMTDVGNRCGDLKHGGDYALLSYVKELLAVTFTAC